MDYKNKYNDALEKLQEALAPKDGREISGLTRSCIEEIFPELKESGDEKMRKSVIYALRNGGFYDNDKTDEAIAWLEKQESVEEIVARCKDSWYNEGKIAGMAEGLSDDEKYQQGWHDAIEKQEEKFDNANKVEPKFNVGDWLCENEPNNYARFIQILEIVNVLGKERYRISRDFHNDEDIVEFDFAEKYYHKFGIADAKDGDVLYSLDSKQPFIFKHRKKHEQAEVYCGINIYGKFFVGNTKDCIITTDKYIPATKEQCDKLLKAITDAGWTFDFEKKELKKIEPKFKVKYAGSEYDVIEIKEFPGGIIYYGIEDEPNHIDYILPENCEIISGYGVKEKGSPYPTKPAIFSGQNPAWSEEDDYNVQCLAAKVTSDIQNGNVDRNQELIDWLKSIKDRVQPQNLWKPSEEQMDALEHFVRSIGESGYASPYDNDTKLIYSLLEQLKQL